MIDLDKGKTPHPAGHPSDLSHVRSVQDVEEDMARLACASIADSENCVDGIIGGVLGKSLTHEVCHHVPLDILAMVLKDIVKGVPPEVHEHVPGCTMRRNSSRLVSFPLLAPKRAPMAIGPPA
eukprot:6330261-Amphidinium_carterae.1